MEADVPNIIEYWGFIAAFVLPPLALLAGVLSLFLGWSAPRRERAAVGRIAHVHR